MNLLFGHFVREKELAEQRALFSECFPETQGFPPETVEFYQREFAEFPGVPPSYEFVARDPVGLAGYYAALPFTYLIGGELFRCGMVCDVMTAARLRGKGVFTKLGAYSMTELEKEGIDFVTGYPRRAEVIPGHLKVGWKIAFPLPMYTLVIRSDALLRSRRLGFFAGAMNLGLRGVEGLLSVLEPSPDGLQSEIWEWRRFLDEHNYDAFFQKWSKSRRNSLVKTESYLRWRLAITGADYYVVTIKRGNDLIGLSIVRDCEPEGIPSLGILDLMCIQDDSVVSAGMLPAWRRLAARLSKEVALVMMSEHQARAMRIGRLGFFRSPVIFKVILNCLSARAKERVLANPEHWSLMWIDTDDL